MMKNLFHLTSFIVGFLLAIITGNASSHYVVAATTPARGGAVLLADNGPNAAPTITERSVNTNSGLVKNKGDLMKSDRAQLVRQILNDNLLRKHFLFTGINSSLETGNVLRLLGLGEHSNAVNDTISKYWSEQMAFEMEHWTILPDQPGNVSVYIPAKSNGGESESFKAALALEIGSDAADILVNNSPDLDTITGGWGKSDRVVKIQLVKPNDPNYGSFKYVMLVMTYPPSVAPEVVSASVEIMDGWPVVKGSGAKVLAAWLFTEKPPAMEHIFSAASGSGK